MNPKEAIMKIRALFEDMPEVESEVEEEMPVEMAEYSLADGTKVMINSLEVNGMVHLEDGSLAPDAEHELADGTKIVTVGGTITEVKPKEEEVVVEAGYDKKKEEEMLSKFDAQQNLIQTLTARIEKLEAKSAQGFSQILDLVEEVTKMPQQDPIEKPIGFKFEQTKDIKFERLNKYRNAILNNKN
jgi:hypothetical protein